MPDLLAFCQCNECRKNVGTDLNNEQRRGRRISTRNYQIHCLQDRLAPINHPNPVLTPSTSSENLDDSYTSGEETPPCGSQLALKNMTSAFMTWLHLDGNLSLKKCGKAQELILRLITQGQHSSQEIPLNHLMPKDIRTVIKNHLNAKVQKIQCCPKCYTLYPTPNVIPNCTYCETPRSAMCNTPLFIQKATILSTETEDKFTSPQRLQHVNTKPTGVFFVQKLTDWLQWFLNLSNTESEIESWRQNLHQSSSTGFVIDIQQGTAWKDLAWVPDPPEATQPSLCLVFSLFVDWFNPRGNKLAGKQASVGIIMMTCVNLPPTMRNKVQYIFVSGLTPGPQSPSFTTISHVLKPLIDELIQFEKPVNIPTHAHPNGRWIQIRLLPLTGDLGAANKVAGFASHSANFFCTWCAAQSKDKWKLALGPARDSSIVRTVSLNWLNAQTTASRDTILRNHGCRYSELNRLSYWDPVKHVALGIMHNWLEGVLMHHFRERWGFQDLSFKEKRRRGKSSSSSSKRPRLDQQLETNDEQHHSPETSQSSDSDVELDSRIFDSCRMASFRQKMMEVVVPSSVDFIPNELGSAKGGKLKASQWYALFCYIIPSIILEMFTENVDNIKNGTNRFNVVANVAYLIQCTHIVCAREVRPWSIQRFTKSYNQYNKTSRLIFPNMVVQPNHHYALHIPEMLALWGPLLGVSEFTGERCIGNLRGWGTNQHLGEMEGTMLKRWIERQMLEVNEHFIQLNDSIPPNGDPSNNIRGRRLILSDDLYLKLLSHVQEDNPDVINYHTLPHASDAKILRPAVHVMGHWVCNGGLKVGILKPNNCLVYNVAGRVQYGFLKTIIAYQDPSDAQKTNVGFKIEPITNLFDKESTRGSHAFRFWLYQMRAAVGRVNRGDWTFIPPSSVLHLCAYRLLEPNVFGIPQDGITLTPVHREPGLQINEP